LLAVGSTTGVLTFLSLDGQKIWSGRAHKNKIQSASFCPGIDYFLVTAGNDKVNHSLESLIIF